MMTTSSMPQLPGLRMPACVRACAADAHVTPQCHICRCKCITTTEHCSDRWLCTMQTQQATFQGWVQDIVMLSTAYMFSV